MSAKAEYAVRAMIQLAAADEGSVVKTDDLAKAQGIPPQFLVDILSGSAHRPAGPQPARPRRRLRAGPACGRDQHRRRAALHRRPAGQRARHRARRPALFWADRRADRRMAGAAGQHALGARGDQPCRRRDRRPAAHMSPDSPTTTAGRSTSGATGAGRPATLNLARSASGDVAVLEARLSLPTRTGG